MVPPECDGGQHRGQFRANAVCGDQVLSAIGGKGKGFRGSADQAIPQNPAALGGRVLVVGHGLRLPRDKQMQCVCRNYCSATYADGAKATRRNVIVNRGPAKAGGRDGFPNTVTDLQGIVFDGLH